MAYDFKNVRVLVVESSHEMFNLFKSVLAMLTVPENNIDSAFSADEAFEKFVQNKHDIIISDWLENPDSGIQLVKNIRTQKDSPHIAVPVIMTAGSGHLSRVLRSRDSGVSDYLVKPFAADTLAKRITRVIESPRPFVIADTYTGPDRRVRSVRFEGDDRRKEKQEYIEE